MRTARRHAVLHESASTELARRFAFQLAPRLIRDQKAKSAGMVPHEIVSWVDEGMPDDDPKEDAALAALEDLIRRLLDVLPKRNRELAAHVIRWYLDGHPPSWVDVLDEVPDLIRRFERVRIEPRDIMRWRDYEALKSAVEDAENDVPQRRIERERAYRESEIVYRSPRWLVVIPKTKESSCFWGRGTRWCIAANRARNMFRAYDRLGGPIYVFIDRENSRKWAVLGKTGDIFDDDDMPVEFEELPDDVRAVMKRHVPAVVEGERTITRYGRGSGDLDDFAAWYEDVVRPAVKAGDLDMVDDAMVEARRRGGSWPDALIAHIALDVDDPAVHRRIGMTAGDVAAMRGDDDAIRRAVRLGATEPLARLLGTVVGAGVDPELVERAENAVMKLADAATDHGGLRDMATFTRGLATHPGTRHPDVYALLQRVENAVIERLLRRIDLGDDDLARNLRDLLGEARTMNTEKRSRRILKEVAHRIARTAIRSALPRAFRRP